MSNIKAWSSGAWTPSSDNPPGVLTKGLTTSTFARGVVAAWADNDSGGWTKLVDLKPQTPTSFVATNNAGRIDLSWSISSTANLGKYEVYYSTSSGGPYTKWGTEPSSSATSAIFGRVASAPVTYYMFVRAVAPSGLYADSDVASVTIGGLSSWTAVSHSRSQSGWHTRSFTFTSGGTFTSTPKRITTDVYWRTNSGASWELATSYTDNNVSTHTKTFSFSAYTYGQRMFRIVTTVEDTQTKQNDGSTGSGYTWTRAHDTSELTAADIAGATPFISTVGNGYSDPGAPYGNGNGFDYGYSRSITATVGWNAGEDRSEFDSGSVVLYGYPNWNYISEQAVDINYLKSTNSERRELSYTFSGLSRSTYYVVVFYANDTEGTSRAPNGGWTLTTGTYSNTWQQYMGTPTSPIGGTTYHAGNGYFNGTIGDAPYGAQYSTSIDQLKDGNNNTWYISQTMTSGTYQRIRFYHWVDYSTNYSAVYPGAVPYTVNWLETFTPQSHKLYLQIYDYKAGGWWGSGADPSVGDPYIATDSVNGAWRVNWNGNVSTVASGNLSYCDFDVRVIVGTPRTYGGLSGTRIGLSELRTNVTWYNRYDAYETRTYYW